MTQRLHVNLLGDLQVTLDGAVVDDFTSKKSLALLSYLAITRRTHTREALSGLLWGESSTSQARASLRTVLWDLRQRLAPFISADRQTISFDWGPSCWVDVLVLRETIGDAFSRPGEVPEGDEERTLLADDQVGALEEAVSLYHGDFMAGFFVSDAPHFEDWMLQERERARQAVLQALHRLLLHYERRHAYRSAIDVGSRLLTIAPWQEEIHRVLMRLLALDGQRSAALVQYETCRKMLAEELDVEPTVKTRLLYRRIKAGKPLGPEQTESASSPLNLNLGHSDLRFEGPALIDRDDAVIALMQMLSAPDGRVVTLVGADGVGKTRLAWSVAEQIAPSFDQGVWVVSVAADDMAGKPSGAASGSADSVSDPARESRLALKIARALGLPISVRSPVQEQLLDHLGHREALLVLDEFEPSKAEIGFVLDILRRAPYIRILVVANRALGIEAEQILQLGGLGLPPRPADGRRAWKRPEELTTYASVRLFVERASQTVLDFELTPACMRHVISLCRSTVGLPLAIELAAAWVDKVPSAQLASAIEYRLGSFRAGRAAGSSAGPSVGPSVGPSAGPSAEQALKAAFSYVWDQLSSSRRLNLSKLAFFPDPFDEDAALDVADVSPATLDWLAKKGVLLRRTSGRYGWHPALRRYTLSRLQEVASGRETGDQSVDPSEFERRYRRHYLGGLARRAAGLRGLGAKTSAAEIRREWSHVRRAWISAVAHADIGILKHSLNGLSRFLSLQGGLWEGVALLEEGVRALTDRDEAPQDGEWLTVVIRLLVEQARLLNAQSLPRRAEPVAESAVELSRTRRPQAPSPDAWTAVEAAGHCEWGRALHGQGKLRAARERLADALALTRDGAPEVRASILTSLGAVERDCEKLDRARELLDQALALYAEREDRWGRSQVLNELGLIAETRSDLTAAAAYAQESLSLSQTMGRHDLESAAHASLGRVALAREDYGAATDHCVQALSIARALGDPRAEARALLALARIHLEEGKREEAWRRSLLAVEQARVAEDPLIEARALLISGHAFTELGMMDHALEAYEGARRLQVILGQSGQVIESLTGLAHATLGRGDPAEAQTFVEEILSRLEGGELVGVSDPVRVYLVCYQVLEANDDPRAREVLATASGLYEEAPADLSRSLDS